MAKEDFLPHMDSLLDEWEIIFSAKLALKAPSYPKSCQGLYILKKSVIFYLMK
jgi:hypothetical protein